LARDSGATLLIVHVEEIPMTTGGGEFVYAIPTVPTDTLRQQLDAVVPDDPSIPVDHRLLAGDAADAIVRTAETDNVDFIVMGTHGRRGLTRLLMGSVAEAIIRRAPCPVLTVKQPAHATAEVKA
jgi:nucleotide-binding universal stress UspA family protein